MKGKCKTCGAVFYGWTMTDLAERKCSRCGGSVKLVADVPISKLSDVLAIRLRH